MIMTILWFVSLLATSLLCGLGHFLAKGLVGKRLALTALTFDVILHLLFAHNRLWVGYQEINAELKQDESRVEVIFKDVSGNPLAMDSKNLDIKELRAQLEQRLFNADEPLPVEPGSLITNPLQRFEFQLKPDTPDQAVQKVRERLQGSSYKRSNPPRDLFYVNLGIDLRGGVEFICRLYDENGRAVAASDDSLRILRARLDKRGLTEPQVVKMSNGDLQVVIPGGTEADAAKTRAVLEKTGRLDVREVMAQHLTAADVERRPNGKWKASLSYRNRKTVASNDVFYPKKPLTGQEPEEFFHLGPAALTGEDIQEVHNTMQNGNLAVAITFDARGGARNQAFTTEVKRKGDGKEGTGFIAFSLDGFVESAPIIESPSGQHCVITGRFTQDEIDALRSVLQAGSLTVTPKILSQQQIGASLGTETIIKGFWSMFFSSLAIFVFVVVYYRRVGWVAVASLTACITMLFAAMMLFDATLTLPGLAGIVLTIGMAVDSNVLIFERIREEMRDDIDLATITHRAYDRVFLTILDSNLTTFIVALILYFAGSGPIKGFGLTLMIGIVTSMFGALYVGRMFNFWLIKTHRQIVIPYWGKIFMLPYMRYRNRAIGFSATVMVIGLGLFFFGGPISRNFDIDFTGGNMVQTVLAKPLDKSQVDDAIAKAYETDKSNAFLEPSGIQIQAYAAGLSLGGGKSRQWLFKSRDEEAAGIEADKDALERRLAEIRKRSDEKRGLAENKVQEEKKQLLAEAQRIDNEEIAPLKKQIDAKDAQLQSRQALFRDQLRKAFNALEPGLLPADESGDLARSLKSCRWEGDRMLMTLALLNPPKTPGPQQVAEDLGKQERFKKVEVTAGADTAHPTVDLKLQFHRQPGQELLDEAVEALVQAVANTKDIKAARKDDRTERLSTTWPDDQTVKVEIALSEAAKPEVITAAQAELAKKETWKNLTLTAGTSTDKPSLVVASSFAKTPWLDKRQEVADQILKQAIEVLAGVGMTVDAPFPSSQHFSAAVGSQMKIWALIAIGISLIGILFYVAARFEFLFGLGAILSLLHDVIISWAACPLLGVRIDLTVVAAILTIIGFSINDTIVIFDRIREELKKNPSLTLAETIDLAVGVCMTRTILTSTTVIATVLALYLFGSESLSGFNKVMLVGLISGTYSTVFIAAPILVWFARGKTTAELLAKDEPLDDEEGEAEAEGT